MAAGRGLWMFCAFLTIYLVQIMGGNQFGIIN